MVKEYGQLLRADAAYSHKAWRVAELTRDLAEFVPQAAVAVAAVARCGPQPKPRVAFHAPCTLQHALKIRGAAESLLRALGAELVPVRDAHLCCGSAGTYSLLQPQLAGTLKAQKLASLLESQPDLVLSANIGCISHLQTGTDVPVRHWIEWVDQMLCPPGVANRQEGVR
jgi:glycolate oxidase iron-sulfur subunit